MNVLAELNGKVFVTDDGKYMHVLCPNCAAAEMETLASVTYRCKGGCGFKLVLSMSAHPDSGTLKAPSASIRLDARSAVLVWWMERWSGISIENVEVNWT